MDLFRLKKVLPEINITDPEIQKFMHEDGTHETKVAKILSYYFERKKSSSMESKSLSEDAHCIKKLLPSQSLLYILQQLEIFKDISNRTEIVLRIIVNSKIYDNARIPSGKGTTSKIQPTHRSDDYDCQPVKVRKLATGTTPVCRVIPANNELWMPKPIVTSKVESKSRINNNLQDCLRNRLVPIRSKQSHMNNDLRRSVGNLEQQGGTLMSHVPKVATSTSLVALRSTRNLTFIGDTISEDFVNHSAEQENGILDLKIISEDELPVAKVFTVSSSAQELKEETFSNSGVLDDHEEVICTINKDQGKPSTSFSDDHVVEQNTLSIARNCTVTSDIGDVNSTVQSEQDLRRVNPAMLLTSDYSHDHVNKLAPILENIDHRKSKVLDQVNDKLLPQANRGDTPNIVPMITDTLQMFTSTAPDCQKVASVVCSVSTNSIQENQFLELTTPTNNSAQMQVHSDVQMQDYSPENFDLILYLYDITNSPLNIIRRECRKLNLSTSTRPDALQLQLVVDKLLTNKISSESSDDEDQVEEVETTPTGDLLQNLNKMINLRSTQDLQSDIVILSENPPKFAKPTATATITSQMQLDHTVSNELQKTVTSATADVQSGESGAAGNPSSSVNNQLVSYLCGIFPDAAPDYIRGLCKNKSMNNEVLDELTTVILSANGTYPKRPPVVAEPDVFPENLFDILKEFLPDADPDYLRMKCDKFEGKADMVKSFINEAMERRNYPTMKDYQRRQQLSAQQRQYTTEFNVENFIKLIPDPHTFFSDPQRTIKMDSLSCHYALVFLRNTFNKLSLRLIQSTFTKNDCKLYKTVNELQHVMTQKHLLMKGTRKIMVMPNNIQNIPLLQEIAYFSHKNAINNYLQEIKDKEEAERKEALSKGLMKTCDCCYDEEVLPKNIFCCEKGCPFCKSCIVKSTEVRFSEGKLDFPCLMDCSSHFTLQTLQAALSPKLFSKIAQKKALEEIKSADIEELEMCPFCDFATIPAEGYNLFSCLNPECMKESCRKCKEPSHIPLRCDEIEKDEDVKARTFVENKMTEALLRKCWKCGIKFFKEEGCNKMTCSCGAKMCYICGTPVTDYKHFNGEGGDRFDLCPLYSDSNVLNKENVLKGAAEAKAEIGNKALKYDPTSDVHQHYKERATKVPQQHLGVNRQQRVEAVFWGVREAIDQLEQRYPHFPF